MTSGARDGKRPKKTLIDLVDGLVLCEQSQVRMVSLDWWKVIYDCVETIVCQPQDFLFVFCSHKQFLAVNALYFAFGVSPVTIDLREESKKFGFSVKCQNCLIEGSGSQIFLGQSMSWNGIGLKRSYVELLYSFYERYS